MGLRAIFGARATRFLDEAWPNLPFVVHGPLKRLSGLVRGTPDLAALMRLPAERTYRQVRDGAKFSNVDLDPAEAAAAHAAGSSVYLWEVTLAGADRFLGALRADLRLPDGLPRVGLFASRAGVGAPIHFDGQESLVVQLIGTKEWTIAPNTNVAWPAVNHVPGDPLPLELSAVWKGRAPKQGTTRVVLKPGSVMFLPRGWWHATRTIADSVHLDLMMPLPTWADLLLDELGAQLRLDPAWREPAVDGARTVERARALLAEAQRFEARAHGADTSRPALAKTRRR